MEIEIRPDLEGDTLAVLAIPNRTTQPMRSIYQAPQLTHEEVIRTALLTIEQHLVHAKTRALSECSVPLRRDESRTPYIWWLYQAPIWQWNGSDTVGLTSEANQILKNLHDRGYWVTEHYESLQVTW